jgi:hypothetical protein
MGLGAEGEALPGMGIVADEWKPSRFLFLGAEAELRGGNSGKGNEKAAQCHTPNFRILECD